MVGSESQFDVTVNVDVLKKLFLIGALGKDNLKTLNVNLSSLTFSTEETQNGTAKEIKAVWESNGITTYMEPVDVVDNIKAASQEICRGEEVDLQILTQPNAPLVITGARLTPSQGASFVFAVRLNKELEEVFPSRPAIDAGPVALPVPAALAPAA